MTGVRRYISRCRLAPHVPLSSGRTLRNCREAADTRGDIVFLHRGVSEDDGRLARRAKVVGGRGVDPDAGLGCSLDDSRKLTRRNATKPDEQMGPRVTTFDLDAPGELLANRREQSRPPCSKLGLIAQDAACLVRPPLCLPVGWTGLLERARYLHHGGHADEASHGDPEAGGGDRGWDRRGFLWKLADPEFSVRAGAWALAMLSCGLAWLVIEYGRDRRRALRNRLRQLRQIDGGGS
jgi:hypothetical protein